MTCPPRAHTGCTPPAAGSDRARWCRTRLRLMASSVGLGFAAKARRGAGDRACGDRLVYAPFDHVVPGVAPTVPHTPTVAGARACGAERDPDSSVDCVQIATTVHDTKNSWQPGRGWRALPHVRRRHPGRHPGPGPARPCPAWPSARAAGARRAPRGRDRATPRDHWITYQHLKPF